MVNILKILNIDIVLLFMIAASGAVAAKIIIGKLSSVAAIDLTKIRDEVERSKRHSLMENRLRRELIGRSKILFVGLNVAVDWFRRFGKAFADKILEFEHHYQEQWEKAWRAKVSPAEKEARLRVVINQAEELVKSEQYREAEKKYIEALSLDAKNAEAYKGLGNAYVLLKEYDHAKEVLKQVIKLNKEDDEAYAELATVETNLGNYDQAETDLLESIKINTVLAVHHIDLGKVYEAKGDLKKAAVQYQEAVKIEPANPKNLSMLLDAAIGLDDKALAQQTLDALKVANPENQKIEEYQTRINAVVAQLVEQLHGKE